MPAQLDKTEHERRISFCENLLVTLPRRSQRHQAFKDEFGLDWRTANRYLQLARARSLAAIDRPKEEQVAEFCGILHAMAFDTKIDVRERIAAIKQYADLTGLHVPKIRTLRVEGGVTVDQTVRSITANASLADLQQLETLYKRLVPTEQKGKALPGPEAEEPASDEWDGFAGE